MRVDIDSNLVFKLVVLGVSAYLVATGREGLALSIAGAYAVMNSAVSGKKQ